MSQNDSFNNNENSHNQFVLSYELLALLQWLAEHEGEKLKKIINKAVASGLLDEIQRYKGLADAHAAEEIQHGIVEFFGVLEALLMETVNEHTMQDALEKNLMPAIDQIDSTVCDNATIRFSIEKATSKLNKSPEQNPEEVLFKELLRCWKPANKKVMH